MYTRYGAFRLKIAPRALPDRFLSRKGSQKAPQNGPKWSRSPFFSLPFSSCFFASFLDNFGLHFGSQNGAIEDYGCHFLGLFFRPRHPGAPQRPPRPHFGSFLDKFWCFFRPPASFLAPIFKCFCLVVGPVFCWLCRVTSTSPAPPRQVYPRGSTHKIRSTPRPLRSPPPTRSGSHRPVFF